jgi:predicted Zn-dependent protease
MAFAGLRSLVAILLLAAGLAHAQPFPTWPAAKMLAETNASQIQLLHHGARVDQVSRESVARALEVTERVAAAFDMAAPDLVIARQHGPNAFAAVGTDGRAVLGINTDMLRLAGHDDALVAAVVGHELGHLKAMHVTEGRHRAAVVSLLGTLLGVAVDISQARQGRYTAGLGTILGSAGANLVNAKFSRDQEREADELAMRAMAKAGFDPASGARIWQLMAQGRGAGAGGGWLDSHPAHPEREQAMAAAAARWQPVYLANVRPASSAGAGAMLVAVDDPYPRSAYAGYTPTDAEVAAATAYARAHAAVAARRFAAAESLLLEAAAAGDERAMALLGSLHAGGELRGVDHASAGYYYQRAASRGFGPALRGMALQALEGSGRSPDPAEAVRLLRLADARDDWRATATLGMLRLHGQAVAKNTAEARMLAERAAGGGDALGKALLGTLLRDGEGGAADPVKGLLLLNEAAATVPWARVQLGLVQGGPQASDSSWVRSGPPPE